LTAGAAAPIGKDYIACSAARRQGICVNRGSVRRSEIETWIVNALQPQLMAPDLSMSLFGPSTDEPVADPLAARATRTEALEIIRSLIDQVIFRPAAEGGLEVELVGELASMVHLAQHTGGGAPTRWAVHEEFARSVKVVAGAGFGRDRHLLAVPI
jgi:hypothetical protein